MFSHPSRVAFPLLRSPGRVSYRTGMALAVWLAIAFAVPLLALWARCCR